MPLLAKRPLSSSSSGRSLPSSTPRQPSQRSNMGDGNDEDVDGPSAKRRRLEGDRDDESYEDYGPGMLPESNEEDPNPDDTEADEEADAQALERKKIAAQKARLDKANAARSKSAPATKPAPALKVPLRELWAQSALKPVTAFGRKSLEDGKLGSKFRLPSFLPGKGVGVDENDRFNPPPALGYRRSNLLNNRPLHDPEADGAIVLYEPPQLSITEQLAALKSSALKEPSGSAAKEVHVVVDPRLGMVLRPHQIEGVRFLYECTTGRKKEGSYGCIMADEMGLGKTLQCITLLWTLLRQSPNPGKQTVDKVVVACPSSLVKNWAKEIGKWLSGRAACLVCDGKESKAELTKHLQQWCVAKGRAVAAPILIISYESLRIYTPVLQKAEIGLMLCDEGHRLKNMESQTYQALNGLKAQRRVILSGTPIQNDLTEYFSLLNFTNPGLLGTGQEFRKNFELPILRGRDALASDKDREASEGKLRELLDVANKFIIRRTAELLTKYLPIKYEHVVFCRLTPAQLQLYQHYATSKSVKRLLDGSAGTQPLKAITVLKKICNHPALLEEKDLQDLTEALPPGFDPKAVQTELSGKMLLLDRMLTMIRKTTDDKIVLISNYTQTLDLFERLCRERRWGCLRLDGSMTVNKRGKLVEKLNDNENKQDFIFLLSSKAGGCGLNLIGANRLVLFDPDWNPANDAQALARVWREGQPKTCYIYRFIATGTLEEKIFQRQAHKQSLSSCVVDEEENVERHFSLENLRQLFQYTGDTLCDTHDQFKCKRCFKGHQLVRPPEGQINAGASAADTSQWNHISQMELSRVADIVLNESSHDVVSYVFQNKSHEQVARKPTEKKSEEDKDDDYTPGKDDDDE